MQTATITHTKNHLSAILDKVRQGETVLILDRNRSIARLEPVVNERGVDSHGRLLRLERAGLLRRGRGKAAPAILRKRPPKPAKGGDILKALLDERRSGR